MRPNIIKLIEGNIVGRFHDIRLGKDFLDVIAKAWAMKAKIVN